MKALLMTLAMIVPAILPGRAEVPEIIDPFYFMLGAMYPGRLAPYEDGDGKKISPNEISFHDGQQRLAGQVLEAARQWTGRKDMGHFQENVSPTIRDRELANKLRDSASEAEVAQIPWIGRREEVSYGQREQLSFVAGVYARAYLPEQKKFSCSPGGATDAALLILLAEGAEVSEVVLHMAVPNTVQFRVKPSPEIGKYFAAVDAWQPTVEWKER